MYTMLDRARPEMAKELADQAAGACALVLAWQVSRFRRLSEGNISLRRPARGAVREAEHRQLQVPHTLAKLQRFLTLHPAY